MVQSSRIDELNSSVQFCKGVGEKRAQVLAKKGIKTVWDLLTYQPRGFEDRRTISTVSTLTGETSETLVVRIIAHDFFGRQRFGRFRNVLKIIAADSTGTVSLVCFNRNFLQKLLTVGDTIILFGRFTRKFNEWQTSSFEYEKIGNENNIDESSPHMRRIVPRYEVTKGITESQLRMIIFTAVKKICPVIQEYLPSDMIDRLHLPSLSKALYHFHFPQSEKAQEQSRKRLAFDRLLMMQLVMARIKHRLADMHKGRIYTKKTIIQKFEQSLSFSLTTAQQRVVQEIITDMQSSHPMNRLLQGDVGSGKTLVALITMLFAAENNVQSALMVPTEILARQHVATIQALINTFPVRAEALVGGIRLRERKSLLTDISSGAINIIVGTHALLHNDVAFKNLGLIIIDEQHRFGVMQRAALHEKSSHPDVLVMTATPIPRTLAMSHYGELDISIIDEMPPGRKPVKTTWVRDTDAQGIYDFIRQEINNKQQVFIVYPLVEESDKMELKNAVKMYENFRSTIFSDYSVGMVHGKMKAQEKNEIMQQFSDGSIDILVATTVIEVGVDIPNATIILIEHADRYGIAQLHQLRGRVGRGGKQAHCILMTKPHITETAYSRMQAMIKYTDGFKLADIDMKIRGPGEFLGTRQHGRVVPPPVDLLRDAAILKKAREEAFRIINDDEHLEREENQALKKQFEFEIQQHEALSGA